MSHILILSNKKAQKYTSKINLEIYFQKYLKSNDVWEWWKCVMLFGILKLMTSWMRMVRIRMRLNFFPFDKHEDESDNEKNNERNENPDSAQSSNHENIFLKN